MNARILPLVVSTCLATQTAFLHAGAPGPPVLTQTEDRVRVEFGGQLFTEYIIHGGPFPYFYPVLAPDGTALTRGFPMEQIEGEARDHTHHRSLWFTHGSVNGVDFWTDNSRRGFIVNESLTATTENGVGIIRATNRWNGPDGQLHCTDETVLRIHATAEGRMIDYEVTIKALPDRPVVLGDTKEGSMAVRVAQWLTPPHRSRGQDSVGSTGTLVNDSGAVNGEVWGKKSAWIDVFGTRDDKVYGFAMFDHPQNPRHPTWWHARTYGLLAANPFGQRDFETAERHHAGMGNLTIPAGGSLTFRWRIYIHPGDTTAARIADRYQDYATGK